MATDVLQLVTERFVELSRSVLGEELVGVYLHGSAAMGCFNGEKSDIDLLTVVEHPVPDGVKRRYMDLLVELNDHAPKKGIEFSVVRREVCKPFVYPTPYELHFSNGHLKRYREDPSDYIAKMRGTDKDLAAHFTVTYHRGKRLYGAEIRDVFGEVGKEYYFDSIWYDVENAEEEIAANPTYLVLNLCRVLAYGQEGLILSKQEGGVWGMSHVPPRYRPLVRQALDEYTSDRSAPWDGGLARRYAAYMLGRIRRENPVAEQVKP